MMSTGNSCREMELNATMLDKEERQEQGVLEFGGEAGISAWAGVSVGPRYFYQQHIEESKAEETNIWGVPKLPRAIPTRASADWPDWCRVYVTSLARLGSAGASPKVGGGAWCETCLAETETDVWLVPDARRAHFGIDPLTGAGETERGENLQRGLISELPGFVLRRPIPFTGEVVSGEVLLVDEVFARFGTGRTLQEAKDDLAEALSDYFRTLLDEHAHLARCAQEHLEQMELHVGL
ncbi:MAG: hypothetical protein R6U88_04420 [Candidatus Bipolaricaulota bacterium]